MGNRGSTWRSVDLLEDRGNEVVYWREPGGPTTCAGRRPESIGDRPQLLVLAAFSSPPNKTFDSHLTADIGGNVIADHYSTRPAGS